jgi:hypothetical protein
VALMARRSLFTNLLVVATGCSLMYLFAPRHGFLRTIYNNTALTTAALVLGFLVADTIGPWLLVTLICRLSRVRDAFLFLVRNLKV